MDQYFGTYQRFETVEKETALLQGADILVGDEFEIVFELEDDVHTAWLVSRFGQRIAFFDPAFSRKLSVYKARDFTLRALLAFVAFTDTPEPGRYWGKMAVIGYPPAYSEVFDKFVGNVSEKLQDGVRPRIDLNKNAVEHLISTGGTWLPKETEPLPTKEKGTAIIKSKRSASEKMIEQGRKKNKGCYVVSWLFIIVVIVLVIIGLKACGVF